MNMKARLLQKYLLRLCLCVVACAYAALSVAAEDTEGALHAALKGRWEGTLTGAFRSQEVSWHFETDEDDALRGFMGPSTAGMPSIAMENLVVDAGQVSFTSGAQHAAFTGTISPDGISGTWRQGTALPLQMRKKNFAFPLSASVSDELVGRWDMQNDGTAIHLEFVQAEGSGVAGFLSIPASDLNDVPLVDIFITDEGYAQFATDNGRRFTGRLVNGVLLGEYVSGETRYRRKFLRAGDERRDYDLRIPEDVRQKMTGRWHCEVRGDDVVLEITITGDNQAHGILLFSEGPVRSDKLLELKVEGDAVSYTTFAGRTFSGSFTDEGIAGDYHNGTRPYGVLFTRE
jgi:hypothetical protein